MLSANVVHELQTVWFPNMTDAGLGRLIDLLESGSPLLIHGCFTRATPMGCLATHVAWHHPRTEHLVHEAGVNWLTRVAGLNPATSAVIREWDYRGPHDWHLRSDLLEVLKTERSRRERKPERPANRQAELAAV
ncbi:MAG TPA: hypothetical protein VKS79_09205 [Gemmataceae bacterium]|nr:hypothetical protein [Gemmataceae bacterium]